MTTKLMSLIASCEQVGNEFLRAFNDEPYILSAIKGLRNGLVYGTRIRAPHALVMVFIFGEGTVAQKLQTIFELTRTHATSLGKFVFGYKLIHGILRDLKGNTSEWHSFAAAFIVGYYVFGEDNSVNMQIILYLLSRITIGLAKLVVHHNILPQPKFRVFPLFAAFVWGIVLWLFEHHTEVLQGSLVKSMTYLYKDSNHWTDIMDFLLWNK